MVLKETDQVYWECEMVLKETDQVYVTEMYQYAQRANQK